MQTSWPKINYLPKNETTVTAIQEVLLDDFALKTNDASKLLNAMLQTHNQW
jgi:hypothetical protein